MIDRKHSLPLVRQARELGIRRGSVYYLARSVSPADLAIMRGIDELHLKSRLLAADVGKLLRRRVQNRRGCRSCEK